MSNASNKPPGGMLEKGSEETIEEAEERIVKQIRGPGLSRFLWNLPPLWILAIFGTILLAGLARIIALALVKR